MELSQEQVERNSHIPTAEIEQDIADTEAEIADLERKAEAYAILGDKMSDFRRTAALNGIEKRRIFIEKLRALLNARR